MIKAPKICPTVRVKIDFIAPGVVITARMAGENYGFSLLLTLESVDLSRLNFVRDKSVLIAAGSI
jgi:hypothetical protein